MLARHPRRDTRRAALAAVAVTAFVLLAWIIAARSWTHVLWAVPICRADGHRRGLGAQRTVRTDQRTAPSPLHSRRRSHATDLCPRGLATCENSGAPLGRSGEEREDSAEVANRRHKHEGVPHGIVEAQPLPKVKEHACRIQHAPTARSQRIAGDRLTITRP